MAKTALKNKAAAKPKFKVRAYTRCQVCGRPHSVYRKFGLCRICLREKAHRGELPGVTKSVGKHRREGPRPDRVLTGTREGGKLTRKGVSPHDNDRSDRRHAYASA